MVKGVYVRVDENEPLERCEFAMLDDYQAAVDGWIEAVAAQPALLTVPLAFGAMIGGSLLTRHRLPPHRERAMVRLHTPEGVTLDRGTFHPERSRRR